MSKDPIDSLDLSDHARATLARARDEQVAADKLSAQLDAVKNPDGKGNAKAKAENTKAADDLSVFDKLTGKAKPKEGDLATPDPNLDRDAYLDALFAANRQADGTYKSFSKTVRDTFAAPTTPAEIDEWYKTQGQTLIAGGRLQRDEAATGIVQAVQNRTITIQKASDIPDLNLHNTLTFEGGEGGGSINGTASWNQNAAILKDPTINARVFSNGYVISWKKPEGDATIGVDFTTDPIVQYLPPIRF